MAALHPSVTDAAVGSIACVLYNELNAALKRARPASKDAVAACCVRAVARAWRIEGGAALDEAKVGRLAAAAAGGDDRAAAVEREAVALAKAVRGRRPNAFERCAFLVRGVERRRVPEDPVVGVSAATASSPPFLALERTRS